MARSWLLALLQLLLLLSVFLDQLFRLLLVLLFQLLLSGLIDRRLREPLMILLLPGLEFLPLIDLLYLELLLLLLVFLVLPGVAGVWSGEVFRWWNILGMDCGAWARGLGGRAIVIDVGARSLDVRASCLIGRAGRVIRGRGWCAVNSSTFSGGYCTAVLEGAGPGGSSDRRLAVVGGGA